MLSPLSFSILKDHWFIAAESMDHYVQLAKDVLAGKEISTGFFSSLKLPDVPANVALVTMAGVLTKADVCGAAGSATLTNMVRAAAADKSIEAIIILSENCPGGQVDGTETFANAIAAAAKVKPVYGAVSGMACSAAVWALTQCTKVFATSTTDMVGCIGTVGRLKNPKATEDADFVEVYSDLSPDKNAEGRDVQVYKDNIINPMCLAFHNAVTAGRGDRLKLKKENVLSGHTYLAPAAQTNGLIDGIKPFSNIISLALADAKKSKLNMKAITTFALILAATGMATMQPLVKGVATETSDEGYLVPEAAMDAIEAQLAAQAVLAATAAAQVTTIDAQQKAGAIAATELATAAAALATANARIAVLEAGDGTTPTSAGKEKDELPGAAVAAKDKYRTSFDATAELYS